MHRTRHPWMQGLSSAPFALSIGSDRRRAVSCAADDSPGKRLAQYSGCVANGTGPACADQTRLLLDHCATIGMMVMVDLAMPFRQIVCGGLSCGPCHPASALAIDQTCMSRADHHCLRHPVHILSWLDAGADQSRGCWAAAARAAWRRSSPQPGSTPTPRAAMSPRLGRR